MDDVIPGRMVDPEEALVLIVFVVESVIYLVEDTADVADEDDEDEQAVENIVYDVEGGPDDVVLEPVVEDLDLVDFGEVDQLQQPVDEQVVVLGHLEHSHYQA